ncbi:GNAT family N-acetyltransferase [Anaerovorax sp. IOR16]|uniref:GNAT family N-acetyltransferase n=1 Tax=Anaerovorax sp. IOR16 TaxID=2773458 RepID=UPI0019D0EF7B|nr:GNAT family N-acetyltransferase [Anaerovorax sp. IOR16]
MNIKDISMKEIDAIKDVWEKNREYHQRLSKEFGYLYDGLNFHDRMKGFLSYDPSLLKISVAEIDGVIVGYCISVCDGQIGEIATLHVLSMYRKEGIGKKLILRHLDWLKKVGCKEITITVSYENIETIEFYRSFGFGENTIEMRLKMI